MTTTQLITRTDLRGNHCTLECTYPDGYQTWRHHYRDGGSYCFTHDPMGLVRYYGFRDDEAVETDREGGVHDSDLVPVGEWRRPERLVLDSVIKYVTLDGNDVVGLHYGPEPIHPCSKPLIGWIKTDAGHLLHQWYTDGTSARKDRRSLYPKLHQPKDSK